MHGRTSVVWNGLYCVHSFLQQQVEVSGVMFIRSGLLPGGVMYSASGSDGILAQIGGGIGQ